MNRWLKYFYERMNKSMDNFDLGFYFSFPFFRVAQHSDIINMEKDGKNWIYNYNFNTGYISRSIRFLGLTSRYSLTE